MWCILAVSLVVWVMGLRKYFQLKSFSRARITFLKNLGSGSFLPVSDEDYVWDKGGEEYDIMMRKIKELREKPENKRKFLLKRAIEEFMVNVKPYMNSAFSPMSVWISVAPLLGLLGTVIGMIHTFRAITLFGVGNPHFTAEGISIALLTTQAGLTVAFPALLFHNFLNNQKTRLMSYLVKDEEFLLKEYS